MLHSRPTLVFKLLIPRRPILYLLPLHPCSCLSLYTSSSSLTISGLFNGMLEVFEPGALNYFTFSRPILLTLSVSNLNSASSFRIPGFSDRTYSRSGILSPDATHASDGDAIIFVKQGLSFSELSTFSLSSLDLYSDYVGINISLNNSSSLFFLKVYGPPPYSLLPHRWQNGLLFSLNSSSRNLFILGDFHCHHPLWDPRGTSDHRGEEVFYWVISSPSMTLTHPPFYIVPFLTSPLFPPFLLTGSASGPGFWPPTNSICSLPGLSLQRACSFLQLSESSLGWLWLPLSFSRGILVSFLCCCSLYLSGTGCGQIFHSIRPHQTPS